MKDNVSVGVSIYHATVTKYIVFTICAVILIHVLHNTIKSLSNCNTFRDNATKAIEFGGEAYHTYQSFQKPQNVVRR
jgi:hypothetical protein